MGEPRRWRYLKGLINQATNEFVELTLIYTYLPFTVGLLKPYFFLTAGKRKVRAT